MSFDLDTCPACGAPFDETEEARRGGDITAGCLACVESVEEDEEDYEGEED